MRQPPRQPPRQQAKPAAKRQPPRATPKAGARQQRGQSGATARANQHARDAQRAQQQRSASKAGRRPQPKGRSPQQGRPLRGWRSWWVTHEMDKQNRSGRKGARGSVGGGFANLRSFGGGRFAGVLTLLLLTLFTGAIALGAQSIPAAVLAFIFFAGALAVLTAARARYHFSQQPAATEEPLEKVAEFRIDDLRTDDEPGDAEVNSMDDLERSLAEQNGSTTRTQAAKTKSPPTVTERVPPDERTTTDPQTSSKPEQPPAQRVSTDRQPPPEAERPADRQPPPEAERPPGQRAPAESEQPSGHAVVETEPHDTEPEVSTDEAAAEAKQPPVTGEPDDDRAGGEDTAAPGEQVEDRDETPSGGQVEDKDEERGEDERDEDEEQDETEDESLDVPDAAADEEDEDIAALMAPLFTDDLLEPEPEPEPSRQSAAPGTSLSLLAAETPGAGPQYSGSESSLPPEAVRDVAATLIVSDLPRSIMFYTELLGLVEIDRAPDAVLLEAGFGRVLLWRRDDAPGAGDPVMHLTFEVGDIDAAYESMRAKGVEFTHPPRAALSGEVHNLRAASFLDPDGHGLAITELREHPSHRQTASADSSDLANPSGMPT